MERKTKMIAEDGRQDLIITREFDLPVELLFLAYTEASLFAQWMSTTVVQLECRPQGAYRCETRGADGAVILRTHGVFHDVVPDKGITRTFQMEDTPFPPQLEFLEFESLGDGTSKLTMHVVYKSAGDRDAMLRLPFAQGLNAAHNRLREAVKMLKQDHYAH